jgi:hypothetical protein
MPNFGFRLLRIKSIVEQNIVNMFSKAQLQTAALTAGLVIAFSVVYNDYVKPALNK